MLALDLRSVPARDRFALHATPLGGIFSLVRLLASEAAAGVVPDHAQSSLAGLAFEFGLS